MSGGVLGFFIFSNFNVFFPPTIKNEINRKYTGIKPGTVKYQQTTHYFPNIWKGSAIFFQNLRKIFPKKKIKIEDIYMHKA